MQKVHFLSARHFGMQGGVGVKLHSFAVMALDGYVPQIYVPARII